MAPGRHFCGAAEAAFESLVLQHELELREFIDLLITEGVSSYLEIGAKFGGSLWRIGMALPPGARIVAIDLPEGSAEWENSKVSLASCITRLREKGRDAHVLWGDSADPRIVAEATELGPFGAVLVDGDHQLLGIKNDWDNYGPMAKIVAFHDIAWRNEPRDRGYLIDAPIFWSGVKREYKHVEIKLDPTGKDNGIGVLWRS